MRQTTLSVALAVKPASQDHLGNLIDALRGRSGMAKSSNSDIYADLTARVPTLHFMSMSLFPGFDFDPLFVIEVNFDGAAPTFWAQLEALIGEDLRAMLRCCKRPLDDDGPLYESVTRAAAPAPVAPYLEARTLRPTVYHHGNRGLTRGRIVDERALFLATRATLAARDDSGPAFRAATAVAVHRHVRGALLPRFTWLDQAAPARIPLTENLADWSRMIAFVLLVVFVLSVPGLVLQALLQWTWFAGACLIIFVVCAATLYRIGKPLPGTATPTRFSFLRFFFARLVVPIAAGVAGYILLVALVAAPFYMRHAQTGFGGSVRAMAVVAGWSAGSIVAVVAVVLVWIRWLERRDATQERPPVDPAMLRAMARREDWIPQNHMGSIVLIKPGLLRAVLIRVGHHALHRVLRVMKASRSGYLGSMRTIHFAHWARVDNHSRLMFFSNFDQTWESYLDDFIEKAHGGLTLAWSSGVGFPSTRFLVKDGASHGLQFKEWARHSMTVSRFWYSAYPDLTANQIERNNRIANGLRKCTLSEKEAAAWALDL